MPAETPQALVNVIPRVRGNTLFWWRAVRGLWAGVAIWLALLQPAAAQISKEYDLKAVLLFHFTRYAEWPTNAFSSPDAPLVIGVLGKDPFGKSLDEVVREEKYNERRIVVARYQTAKSARDSHILFISESERDKLSAILAELKSAPVLTVSEADDFTAKGGMIAFYKNSDNKLRPRVNLAVLKKAGLSLGAKFLRVAEVIQPRGE
jgi:hypothetical protein